MPVPGHKTEEKVFITRKWQRIRTQTRSDGAFEAEAHVSKINKSTHCFRNTVSRLCLSERVT